MANPFQKIWQKIRGKGRNPPAVPPVPPPDLTPYVVLLEAPTGFDSSTVTIGDFKGLLYVQLLYNPAKRETRLVAGWRSKDAYDGAKDSFCKTLDLGVAHPPVLWEGLHSDIRVPKPGWRHYFTAGRAYTFLVSVIAFVMSILVCAGQLRDTYGWICEPPEVEASNTPNQVNVLVGQPFTVNLKIHNARSLGNCSVEFTDDIKQEPLGGLNIDSLEEKRFPAIPPNGRLDPPPVLTGQTRSPGDHKITVTGVARSGLFRQSITFHSEHHVKAWLPYEFSQPLVKTVFRNGCLVAVDLLAGKTYDNGLVIEAQLLGTRGVKFNVVLFPGDSHPLKPYYNGDTPREEQASQKCETGRIEGMNVYPFTLLLDKDGDELSKEKWEGIVQKLQLFASVRTKPVASADPPK